MDGSIGKSQSTKIVKWACLLEYLIKGGIDESSFVQEKIPILFLRF